MNENDEHKFVNHKILQCYNAVEYIIYTFD